MDKDPDEKSEGNNDPIKDVEDVAIEGLEKKELEEIDLDGLDEEEIDEDPDKKSKEKEETVPKKDFEDLQANFKKLEGDKRNLNKALHEARQKKAGKEDAPLTDKQLLKILEDNDDDPQTILNVVKYQAEQAAKKASGEVVSDAETRKKSKEADTLLKSMYPSLDDDSSDMRKAVNETKLYYGLGDNPLGDFFATGIQVLNALPDLITSAEKRGEETALKGKADDKRKKSIKDNLSLKGGKEVLSTGLTESQTETASQLNLSDAQMKTFKKIVGKTATVTVKE
ncbi:MAG: hypothetical protein U9O65_05535 [Thermotogota bacterium]|nr:hypothetical protein [Thermotogota bacterium]